MSDPADTTPTFSWRRELLWMLIPAAVALAVHLPAVPYADGVWNGDGAITALMAKHHWEGKLPIYFYGQNYNGSLEPLIAAPFYGIYGASLKGVAISKTLLLALVSMAIFRLCFELGGRGAALAGSLPFAIGTWTLTLSLARLNSYLVLLLLGCAILLVCRPLIDRPTGKRAFGLGILVGLAWFNNPQIASFLVPPIGLLILRGELCRRIHEEGPSSLHVAVRVVLGVLLLWVLFSVGLAAIGGFKTQLGEVTVSLQKPAQYFFRSVAALGAAIVGLQFCYSPDRSRWVRVGGLFGGGFLVGDIGHLYFKLFTRHDHVRHLKSALHPGMVLRHLDDFRRHAAEVLLNRKPELDGMPVPGGPLIDWLGWAVIALVALGVLGWFVAHRTELADIFRLRPARAGLGLMLGLQAIGLTGLYLMHPIPEVFNRYLVCWWPAYCGLFAGLFAALQRRVGPAAWLVAALWIAYFAGGALRTHQLLKHLHEHRPDVPAYRMLIAEIEKRGVTRGYANYWFAFPMTYLTDEKLILRTWPDPKIQDPVHPPYVEAVSQASRHVWIFKTRDVEDDRRMLEQFEHHIRHRLRVTETVRKGDWLLYFTER